MCPEKLTIFEGQRKTWHDKSKLKVFMANKPSIHILKKMLPSEEEDKYT